MPKALPVKELPPLKDVGKLFSTRLHALSVKVLSSNAAVLGGYPVEAVY